MINGFQRTLKQSKSVDLTNLGILFSSLNQNTQEEFFDFLRNEKNSLPNEFTPSELYMASIVFTNIFRRLKKEDFDYLRKIYMRFCGKEI